MGTCYAEIYKATIKDEGVSLRKGPGTNYDPLVTVEKGSNYRIVDIEKKTSEAECENGWYQLFVNETDTGYVCSDNVTTSSIPYIDGDEYERPWTTPKKAIVGGAKYISKFYVKKGQFTSYLKKFNVNPNGSYSVYNHQYMANLAAPYSEAYSSYKSYRDNGLLLLPLEFTIPIFENMPEHTALPGSSPNTDCQSEVTDEEFESKLNEQNFPESYKCKLRLIHNAYPNWTFIAMHTGLDFNKSVIAEKSVSSIQGGDKYYDLSSGKRIQTEKGWYKANNETVAFYLDPRNFLVVERILMFENLGYSANYTEPVVSSILSGTFMDGYSFLDNELFSKIFVEAGVEASMSSVYLASLAKQESGTKGGRGTSGTEFTYKGITYNNLYNFYNIGASSSAESPVLAGLVWASGGSDLVVVYNTNNSGETNNVGTQNINEELILQKLNVIKQSGCITNLSIGITLGKVKELLTDYNVSVVDLNDNDILKTGDNLVISKDNDTLTYQIAIKGDVDGDGKISSNDYVKIKNYIMETNGSELSVSQSIAADVDNSNSIGSSDYVKIKNIIMER
jgi:beta-N-acetylglucosaminidase